MELVMAQTKFRDDAFQFPCQVTTILDFCSSGFFRISLSRIFNVAVLSEVSLHIALEFGGISDPRIL